MEIQFHLVRFVVSKEKEGMKQILCEKVGLILYAQERSHANCNNRFIIRIQGRVIGVSCF